nr:MAG TPA: hypothetical protein [Caudoviricetes sp.]
MGNLLLLFIFSSIEKYIFIDIILIQNTYHI